MKNNPGDIIDRFCISILKNERIGGLETGREFNYYLHGYQEVLTEFPGIDWGDIKLKMLKYHSKIWNLESALRKGAIDHDLEECGRRAIKIREWNKKRIELRNKINELTNQGLKDVRKDHLSE